MYIVYLMYHCWTLGYVGEGFGHVRRNNEGVCDVGGMSDVVGLLGDLVNNCLGVLDGVDMSDIDCSDVE